MASSRPLETVSDLRNFPKANRIVPQVKQQSRLKSLIQVKLLLLFSLPSFIINDVL